MHEELVLRRNSLKIKGLPTDSPVYRTFGIAYKDKDSLPIARKYFIKYLKENKDIPS